jgi:uncharacterized protein (TIGR02284 family)
MARTNAECTQVLNDLIETVKDGEHGFHTAAETATDASLKELFGNYAQQRARFAEDLQLAVRRLGGEPIDRGSVVGALHRGWMSIKGVVAGAAGISDAAIVAEAERGEDHAVEAFEKAIASDLPLDVQAVVERQYMQIKESHDRIRDLERQLEPTTK